jgi:hypothetical protein
VGLAGVETDEINIVVLNILEVDLFLFLRVVVKLSNGGPERIVCVMIQSEGKRL